MIHMLNPIAKEKLLEVRQNEYLKTRKVIWKRLPHSNKCLLFWGL